MAKLLKLANFIVYRAVLPFECEIRPDVVLLHRGTGTVIHPNTRIGSKVRIGHNVTITAGSQSPGSDHRAILEDGVFVASGASIVPKRGRSLTVGQGARIGIGALVINDVPAGATMVAPAAAQVG